MIAASEVADRREVVGGDFFAAVPTGGDAHILKWIIHDRDDEKSVADPEELSPSLAENGKLILVEAVVPPGSEPHFSKFMDRTLLVITGGHERTEAKFRRLYEASGFRLTRIVPTESPFSVIEGVRA